jgi:polyphosphate glucokinase
MKILVIDIGGNSVKVLVSGETDPRKFPSGPLLTPRQMVAGVLKLTEDWKYDAVSIGYPGRVRDSRPFLEPVNLGRGGSSSIMQPHSLPCQNHKRRRHAGAGKL